MKFRKTTDTKIIGIAGAGPKCGCTHSSIVIANALKKQGFKVALMEENNSNAFRQIAEEFDCRINDDDGFNYYGIDYYMYRKPRRLPVILGKGYDYVIVDHGEFRKCDKDFFATNFPNIIMCGSRPWEINEMNNIFEEEEDEAVLKSYHYCFIFASGNKSLQRTIRENMDTLHNVYFPPYSEYVFKDTSFPDIEKILGIRFKNTQQSTQVEKTSIEKAPEQRKNPFTGILGMVRRTETDPDIDEDVDAHIVEIEDLASDMPKAETADESASLFIEKTPEIGEKNEGAERVTINFAQEPKEQETESSTDAFLKPMDTVEETSTPLVALEEAETELIYDDEPADIPVLSETTVAAPLNAPNRLHKQESKEDVPIQKTEHAPVYATTNTQDAYIQPQLIDVATNIFLLTREIVKCRDFTGLNPAIDEECNSILLALSKKQIQCAVGSLLRSGVAHTRENGQDGSPGIKIDNENVQFLVNERAMRDTLEEDAAFLIAPKHDNYMDF